MSHSSSVRCVNLLFFCLVNVISSEAFAQVLQVQSEFEIDAPVNSMKSSANYYEPHTVGTNDGFLTFWTDGFGTGRIGARIDGETMKVMDLIESSDIYIYGLGCAASNGSTILLVADGSARLLNAADAAPNGELQQLFDYPPKIAATAVDGGNYLLTWPIDGHEVRGLRIDGRTGEIMDEPGGFLIASNLNVDYLAAAGDDDTFVVAFRNYREDTQTDEISAVRIASDGSPPILDDTVLKNDDLYVIDVDAASTNAGAVIIWTVADASGRSIYASLMPSGEIQNSTPPQRVFAATDPKEAFFGIAASGSPDEVLIAWAEKCPAASSCAERVVGTRFFVSQDIITTNALIEISESNESQDEPSIAYRNGQFMTTWQDHRYAAWKIFGAFIADGTVRNPSDIPISTANNDQLYPRLEEWDTGFVLTWYDNRRFDETDWELRDTFVSRNGCVYPASTLLLQPLTDIEDTWCVAGTCNVLWPASAGPAITQVDLATSAVQERVYQWSDPFPTARTLTTDTDVLGVFADDDQIRIFSLADPTAPASLGSPIERVTTATEQDGKPGRWKINDVKSAYLDGVVFLIWKECFDRDIAPCDESPNEGPPLCSMFFQRLRLDDLKSGVARSEVVPLETASRSLLGFDVVASSDHFIVFRSEGIIYDDRGLVFDGMRTSALRFSPDGAGDDLSPAEIRTGDISVSDISAEPFEGGTLLVYRATIPVITATSSRYHEELYAGYVSSALEAQGDPMFLSRSTKEPMGPNDFSLAVNDDTAMIAVSAYRESARRIVSRILRLENDVFDGDASVRDASVDDSESCVFPVTADTETVEQTDPDDTESAQTDPNDTDARAVLDSDTQDIAADTGSAQDTGPGEHDAPLTNSTTNDTSSCNCNIVGSSSPSTWELLCSLF